MVRRIFKTDLLAGAALFTGIAIFGGAQAKAESLCTINVSASTFDCIDDSGAPTSGSGSFSAGTTVLPSVYGQLAIVNTGDLNLALETGELTSTSDSVVFAFSGGHLSYASDGITTSSGVDWLTNTMLNGVSVEANTGTVQASGHGVGGVHSVATNGNNLTTGGITVVAGDGSRGLSTLAINGNNVTNTGVVSVTGNHSRGVDARTSGTSCGTNTVNVTGNVSAGNYAILTRACGASTVNVLAGNTAATSVASIGYATILIDALTVATTTIDGTVAAAAANLGALEVYGTSSVTQIGSTGVMTGTFSGTNGADTFTIDSGGIWNTAGATDFRFGTDWLANAGSIFASGVTNLAGLESFMNSGTINMANGAIGDSLSLGDYAGSGGASLYIDATETGADLLLIGGHASGTTSLFVNTGVLIPDPVLVVDTVSSETDAFVLGNTSATPLIDVNLTQSGDDYFVTAVPSETAQQTMQIAVTSQRRWQRSADDLLGGSVLKRSSTSRDRRTPFAFWARSYPGSGDYVAQSANHLTSGRTGVQAGFDYFVADSVLVGVTGGYDGRETNIRTNIGGLQSKASNFGAYIQYAGANGFYAGLLAKADRSDVQLTHRAFIGADSDPDSKTIGAEAEAGFRTTAMGFNLDASGGLAYIRSQTGDFTVDGMSFDFGNAKSLRGRLGVRGEFGGRHGLFADAKVYHEFHGGNELTVRTGAQKYAIEAGSRSTWARFEAGFGGQGDSDSMLSAWAEMGAGKSLGMKAGFRF